MERSRALQTLSSDVTCRAHRRLRRHAQETTKSVGWLVEVLHEDGELPVGVAQLPRHRLPLEDQGADLDEVLVALHALVVPEMNDIYSSGYSQMLQHE